MPNWLASTSRNDFNNIWEVMFQLPRGENCKQTITFRNRACSRQARRGNQPTIPTNLDDLADVNAATPTTNNVLYWNGSVWKNGEVPLDALSNVTVPAPTNGQVLTYDTATNTWITMNPFLVKAELQGLSLI